MELCTRDRLIALSAACYENKDSIQKHDTTGKQLVWLTRQPSSKTSLELVLKLQGKSSYQSYHPEEIITLLKYYSDVIIEKSPSELPPKKGLK